MKEADKECKDLDSRTHKVFKLKAGAELGLDAGVDRLLVGHGVWDRGRVASAVA